MDKFGKTIVRKLFEIPLPAYVPHLTYRQPKQDDVGSILK